MMVFDQERMEKLGQLLPNVEIKWGEPLKNHTSFHIGGRCFAMAFPKNQKELTDCLQMSKLLDIKCCILGAGTNILAPDDGIDALVICLKDCFSGMEKVSEDTIQVMAGVTMSRAAVFAANQGLSGMEFAHGIPGTVGGGVYMNAGAYGGEIGKICTKVLVLKSNGEAQWCTGEEMHFSYRHSILEETGDIVVCAEFALLPDDPEKIKATMKTLGEKRRASQPLDYPSAGSAFKRPVGGYAAALIDEAGLKGFSVGDAAVSTKHAGFVVNLGDATAQDVKTLLQEVSRIVKENSGILLEPEIRIW